VVGFYPEVLPESLPAIFVLRKTGLPILIIVFQVVLFGTLIETGTGFIHAVNERIQSSLSSRGRTLAHWQRPVISLVLLLVALGISTFGLIQLIAKGYGTVSWGFLFIFILPLFTLGIVRLRQKIKKMDKNFSQG
jgi:uncharacterized membrane protein YkvI